MAKKQEIKKSANQNVRRALQEARERNEASQAPEYVPPSTPPTPKKGKS